MIDTKVKPVKWVESGKHFYSGEYTLVCFDDGFLVDFDDLGLMSGLSLSEAKKCALDHYTTTGENK